MATRTAESLAILSGDQALEVARRALAAAGYTFGELAAQHDRDDFDNLNARLTWDVVRDIGDPAAH